MKQLIPVESHIISHDTFWRSTVNILRPTWRGKGYQSSRDLYSCEVRSKLSTNPSRRRCWLFGDKAAIILFFFFPSPKKNVIRCGLHPPLGHAQSSACAVHFPPGGVDWALIISDHPYVHNLTRCVSPFDWCLYQEITKTWSLSLSLYDTKWRREALTRRPQKSSK